MMRSILTLLLAAAAIIAGSNVYAMPDIGPGSGPRGGGWQTGIDIGPGSGPRGGDWQTTILGDKPGWHPLPPARDWHTASSDQEFEIPSSCPECGSTKLLITFHGRTGIGGWYCRDCHKSGSLWKKKK